MITYAFPGQGSQAIGMGAEFFDLFPNVIEKADKVLGYSIKSLCLEDKLNVLSNTQFTQPALYVVNALTYLNEVKYTNKLPDYVLGHSLGEYNALFAAGVFDFETGLKLVKKRGELMSKVTGGSMAAVMNLPEEEIWKVLDQEGLKDSIMIANYNTPSQIVLAGPMIEINYLKEKIEANGAKYSILKVSGAFHSKYMKGIQKEFADYIDEISFSEPTLPVISNYTAREYKKGQVKELLLEQLVKPVKWTESIRYLMGKGDMEFKQIGPGFVVKRLIENIQKNAEPIIINEGLIHYEELMKNQSMKDNDLSIHNETGNDSNDSDKKYSFQSKIGPEDFRSKFHTVCNYVAGGMGYGISTKEMMLALGQHKIIGFLGTYGRERKDIEADLSVIKSRLTYPQVIGVNIVNDIVEREKEFEYFEIIKQFDIDRIEVSSYFNITESLVEYRLKGLMRTEDNGVKEKHHIFAKVSRPEIAELFLSPPPQSIINKLLNEKKISKEEAELGKQVSVCSSLCMESGRDTDIGLGLLLIDRILRRREEIRESKKLLTHVFVGLSGGIGSPSMIANAFRLGAEFVTTGSINQCTVEAGTSDRVKNILSEVDILDTAYAPSKLLFEWGGKISVVKRGTFFPYRANKLYDIYSQYNNLNDMDYHLKIHLEEKYFHKTLNEICCELYKKSEEEVIPLLNERSTMVDVFKWYLDNANNEAITGDDKNQSSYCIYSTASMGCFNEWVKGTKLVDWHNRHVDLIAIQLLIEAEEILNKY